MFLVSPKQFWWIVVDSRSRLNTHQTWRSLLDEKWNTTITTVRLVLIKSHLDTWILRFYGHDSIGNVFSAVKAMLWLDSHLDSNYFALVDFCRPGLGRFHLNSLKIKILEFNKKTNTTLNDSTINMTYKSVCYIAHFHESVVICTGCTAWYQTRWVLRFVVLPLHLTTILQSL